MLKPKLQSFGHLMRRTDSLEKTLMLGKIEGGKKEVRSPTSGLPWWLSGKESASNDRDVDSIPGLG